MEEYFLIATVKSVYNDDGFLKITSFSDFPERFFQLKKVFIQIYGNVKEITVEHTDFVNNTVVLKFANFDSYEDAYALIGAKILVKSKDAVTLPQDMYYIHDLIGAKVIKDKKFFGELKEVITLPSNDVYAISTEDNMEILIPAIKDYIESFDKVNKILYLVPGCDLSYAED